MSKPSMEEQLKSGKILPLLLKLAIPGTIAQIVNALYSMVDRIFIGRMEGVGLTALAGLGLTLEKTWKLIGAKEFLVLKLTGKFGFTDYGDASGSCMFDIHTKKYSGEILDAVGIPEYVLRNRATVRKWWGL